MTTYLTSECRADPEVFSIDALARVQDLLQSDFPNLPIIQHNQPQKVDITKSDQPQIYSAYTWVSQHQKKARFLFYPNYPKRSFSRDKEPVDLEQKVVDGLSSFLLDFFGIQSDDYTGLKQVVTAGAKQYMQDRAQAKERTAQAKTNIEAELKNLRVAIEQLVAVRAQQYPGLHDLPYEQRRVNDRESPWNTFCDKGAADKILAYARKEGLSLTDWFFCHDTRQHYELQTKDGEKIPLTVVYSGYDGQYPTVFPIEGIIKCSPTIRIDATLATPSSGFYTDQAAWIIPFDDIDFEEMMKPKIDNSPHDYRLKSEVSVHTADYGTDIRIRSHHTQPELHDKLTHILQVSFSVHLNRSKIKLK